MYVELLLKSSEESGNAEDVPGQNDGAGLSLRNLRRGCHIPSPSGGSSSEAGKMLLVDTHKHRPCMYTHPAPQIAQVGMCSTHTRPHWAVRMKDHS